MGSSCSISRPSVIDFEDGSTENVPKKSMVEKIKTGLTINQEDRRTVKVLLLGAGESGKSTIVKQMKVLHMGGFSESELAMYRSAVRGNIIDAITTLVKEMEKLSLDYEHEASKRAATEILEKGDVVELSKRPEKFGLLRRLFTIIITDSRVQSCFKTSPRLKDSSEYFLNQIEVVFREDYIPSVQDILRTRIVTTGIREIFFQFKGMRFNMIDVGGQRSERKKWLRCFDSVHAVIFVVALSEYDQVLAEDEKTNRMSESLRLFHQMCGHTAFTNSAMILFLNKKDRFSEKLKGTPLKACFPNYEGKNNFRDASTFVWEKFMEVRGEKAVFSHLTCATDTESLDVVFTAVTETLIRTVLGQIGLA